MSSSDAVKVSDVMSSPVRTISRRETVQAAAREMREHDISALVVTTSPAAIITSTDILDAIAAGREISELTVADVMTSPVETIPPDIRLNEVGAMMTNYGVKHLPVVDDDYVGMISTTDLAKHLA